jgi:hypothetical protein
MLDLKLETQFNNYCELTIEDTTGYVAPDNLNGFLPEGMVPFENNQYHISDGYFFNILSYNGYNCNPVILNPKEAPIKLNSIDVESVYEDNNLSYTYTLDKDGMNVLTRIFVISKAFYEMKNSSFFGGKTVIYYDPAVDKIYKIDGTTHVEISKYQLLTGLNSNQTGDYVQISIFSVCKLNTLSYKLETKLLNSCILICSEKIDKQLIVARDYVFMLLNTIKYLRQLNQISEAQRVIEASNSYCSLFTNLVSDSNLKDCNCNG